MMSKHWKSGNLIEFENDEIHICGVRVDKIYEAKQIWRNLEYMKSRVQIYKSDFCFHCGLNDSMGFIHSFFPTRSRRMGRLSSRKVDMSILMVDFVGNCDSLARM